MLKTPDTRKKQYVVHIFLVLFLILPAAGVRGEEDKNSEALANYHRQPWSIGPAMKSFLPSGDDIASILELWYIGGLVHGPSAGGINKLHPIRYSVYGGSHINNRWFLNGFDLTDPGRDGTALFRIPFELWDAFQVRAIEHTASDKRGLHFQLSNTRPKSMVKSRGASHVGGPYIIFPKDLFDRDPLYAWTEFGTIKNRELRRATDTSVALPVADTQLFASFSENNMQYVYPEGFQARSRDASLFWLKNDSHEKERRTDWLTAVNVHHNDIYNAWYGLTDTTGTALDSGSLHAQWRLANRINRTGGSRLGFAVSAKYEDMPGLLPEGSQRIRHFELERSSVPEPELPRTKLIGKLEGTFQYNILSNQQSSFTFQADVQQSYLATEWHDSYPIQPRFLTNQALDVLMYSNFTSAREAITRIKAGTAYVQQWETFSLDAYAGLSDSFALMSGENNALHFFGVDARISAELDLGGLSLASGASIEPGQMNHEISEYLTTDTPGWQRYEWTDSNGNSLYDAGEAGSLLGQYGGPYSKKGDFRQPWQSSFYLGTRIPFSKEWGLTFNLINRLFFNQLKVSYPDNIEDSFVYNPTNQVYDRDTSLIADDYYVLDNYDKIGEYWGMELNLLGISRKSYYFNLSAAAYLMRGYATLGNGILYNDPGILDYMQADPNHMLEGYFRLASDRAYFIMLSGGVMFSEGLLGSFTLRYRDGEPFRSHRLLESNYGTVKRERFNILRYTFFMDLSIRIQYSFRIQQTRMTATFDIYNTLGSNTELKEYAIGGETARLPVEATPDRMVMFSLKAQF